MKIAVLGAGAMGSIYGGHLSLHNDVYMIDKKQEIVDKKSMLTDLSFLRMIKM